MRLFARQAGAFGGSAVPAEPTARRCRGPLSGGEACPENVGAGLETQPTGGLAEQASNTARGTPKAPALRDGYLLCT